jgi:hypothetical protein
MTLETETSRFVHRANILKYKRILTTYVTDHERRFIERRLAEEQAALQRLGGNVASKCEFVCAA